MRKEKSFGKTLAYGFIFICVVFDFVLGFSHAETWTKIFGIVCFSLAGFAAAIFMPEMHSENKHAKYEIKKRRSQYEAIKAKRRLRDARLAPKLADHDRRNFIAFMFRYARRRNLRTMAEISNAFCGWLLPSIVEAYKATLPKGTTFIGGDKEAIKYALNVYPRLIGLH